MSANDTLLQFNEKPQQAPKKPSDGGRSVKWLDGLRGIASFTVILTHLARAFDYDLFHPSDAPGKPPRFNQLPYIRLLWQGRIGVTIFALLTGYVCALKPLKQLRAGDRAGAQNTLGKSTLRRPFRLIMPAAIALCMQWLLAQFNAFEVAHSTDSSFMRDSSVRTRDSLWGELLHLWHCLRGTWTNGVQNYDDHQWALLPLLKTSYYVYLALGALVYVRFRMRLVIYTLGFAYFWQDKRIDSETFGAQAFYGMFLCDLSMHQPFTAFLNAHKWPRRIASGGLILGGLYIASYPFEFPEWVAWSRQLVKLNWYLFPEGSHLPKRFTAVGTDMLLLGIQISPGVRDALASRIPLLLGKNSFAVYLVHGTLLRTLLMWMIYGVHTLPAKEIKEQYFLHRGSHLRFAICLPIWFFVVYSCAHYWTLYVDSFCARLTQRIENYLCKEDEDSSSEKARLVLP